MERSPTDVHAAPLAAAPADTAMNMAKHPSPSTARVTGIRVRQTANSHLHRPERPENQTWTPRTGGYRNPSPAPSLAHHATLTGRCRKPTFSRSSPCVNDRMCSDFFKAAERLANMSDLLLTLSAPDHTPKDRLSRDSRSETTHTKDTISPPEPDAPAPGVEPPNERQAAFPPEPQNLNLTDDHLLRPVLASATTGEPPYPHLHPSLTHVQQDDLSFQPIFPQQDHPNFNQEREQAICPLNFFLQRTSIPVPIRSTLFSAHTSALGQSTQDGFRAVLSPKRFPQ
jgi:hypothetical protein